MAEKVKKGLSKKNKDTGKKINSSQLEFDFNTKYVIKWHGIVENEGNKKGYKTRVRYVKDIVNDKKLVFRNFSEASDYVIIDLCNALIHHEMAENSKVTRKGVDLNHISTNVFTAKVIDSNVKYWIEIEEYK